VPVPPSKRQRGFRRLPKRLSVKNLASRTARLVLVCVGGILSSGCANERILAAGRSYSLRVVGGDAQSAPAGGLLPNALRVEVRDVAGVPVKAAVVVFRVALGSADGAVFVDSMSVTAADGIAAAELQLGAGAGRVEVLAFPLGAPDRAARFTATATAGPTLTGLLPVNVGPGDTLRLAGGALGGLAAVVEIGPARLRPVGGTESELRVVVPDCLPAGALAVRVLTGGASTLSRAVTYAPRRRPLALPPYAAMTIGASEVGSCIALAADAATEYVLVPQLASQAPSLVAITARVTAGGATGLTNLVALFSEPARGLTPARLSAQAELDVSLREEERRLAALVRDAPPPATPLAPPMLALTLGSLRSFHVISNREGTAFNLATGRLRFLGEHIAIYVDTTAWYGYRDDELASLGRHFDQEIYPTVTSAFGPEPDMDKNGRVVVFMTPRVNALTPAQDCALRGFVTGFFFGRDLLPTASYSNAGEVYYALVPDPFGEYSCAHAKADATRLTTGVFAHELQHLISFFHHVVARGGEPEELWLNEGLSHVAEELMSKRYEARYPPPLGRLTAQQIFPDSSQPFITPQLLNAYVYLNATPGHSVTTFAGTGSPQERGAAWLFLRWLGDQKGESIYARLVQTGQRGTANIAARAGEPFASLFGDFSAALWADSLIGVPRDAVSPRHRFHSRNLRQLMARQATIAGFPDPFPVKPVRIPVGGWAEGGLVPGTMAFTSLGPFSPGQPPVVLGFTRTDGSLFGAGQGAQVTVIRVK